MKRHRTHLSRAILDISGTLLSFPQDLYATIAKSTGSKTSPGSQNKAESLRRPSYAQPVSVDAIGRSEERTVRERSSLQTCWVLAFKTA